jgi:hypothetical protein
MPHRLVVPGSESIERGPDIGIVADNVDQRGKYPVAADDAFELRRVFVPRSEDVRYVAAHEARYLGSGILLGGRAGQPPRCRIFGDCGQMGHDIPDRPARTRRDGPLWVPKMVSALVRRMFVLVDEPVESVASAHGEVRDRRWSGDRFR